MQYAPGVRGPLQGTPCAPCTVMVQHRFNYSGFLFWLLLHFPQRWNQLGWIMNALWMLIMLLIIHYSYTLDHHRFLQGSDASISFIINLNGSRIEYEIFSLNAEHPFYRNKEFDQTALQPGQQDRFSIIAEQRSENFTITLLIQEIQTIDVGVYILAIREEKDGNTVNHILDAYINVIFPPSKANCTVELSGSHPKFQEIHCNAILGSDKSGNLVCYQNSEELCLSVMFFAQHFHTRKLLDECGLSD